MLKGAPIVLILLATVAAPTLAQDAEDPRIAQARERFDVAEAAFHRNDFTLALAAYTEVFETMEEVGHPNAIVLYDMARASERLGRDAEALAQYERYLSEAGADAPNRDVAADRAAELLRRAGPRRRLRGGGGVSPVGGVSPAGPIIASVGAASMIVGAVLGGIALSERNAASAGCIDGSCPSGARDGLANAEALANRSDALLFAGLAIAATGVVQTFALDDGGGEIAASAACDPTMRAVVGGTFC